MTFNRVMGLAVLLVVGIGHPPSTFAGIVDGMGAFDRGDYATALKELLPEAENGNADAQFNLGRVYESMPEEIPPVWYEEQSARIARFVRWQERQEEALRWYREAAQQGLAQAQHSLGRLIRKRATIRDYSEQSAFWFRKAAEQGYAIAQVDLAWLYQIGQGVARDSTEAAFWYFKAAEQGTSGAQRELGRLYYAGEGVAKDDQQAYFWLRLSSAKTGQRVPELLSEVERTLSAEQRVAANTAVRDWIPKASAPPGPFIPVPVPKRERPPSAALPKEASSTGSGFRVSPEYFVTNYHVAGECGRLRIAGKSNGRIVAVDSRADLALIAVAPRSTAVSAIRVGKATLGEPVTVAGFPLTGLLSGLNITTGNVSSLSGVRGDTSLLQITAPVQAGNSGGPLLDAGGSVIGVVVSKLDAEWVAKVAGDVPQNVNFAINGNVLASFLDSNGIAYKSSVAGSKLSTQEVAKRAQAFTALVECWK